jgi:SPP1 gp7 family putative phage head morphogenesis protein
MNASTLLLHILLDNGLYLDGWSRDEIAKLVPILEAAGERVMGKVAATNGEWTKKWLMGVKADLDAIYRAACEELSGQLLLDLKEMTDDEAQRLTAAFGEALPGISFAAPGSAQLWAAVTKLPAMEGSTIGGMLSALPADLSSRVVSIIQAGIAAGDTNAQMIQRLRGKYNRSTKQYEGGALDSNSAKAIVRTATAHVGNQAREALYRENMDLIKGFQCYETLDLDTCPVCGAYDGRVYGVNDPRPELPRHPRCRGGYLPVLKSYREIGVDMDQLPPSTRASMDGQVPETETYADRLAKATHAERIKMLGGTGRAALYEAGVSLEDMVRDGKLVPLAELIGKKRGKAA